MKLDRVFARDINREANANGSRDAKFAFLKRVEAANKALSVPDVAHGGFDAVIKEHGRVPVMICVAATLYNRRERLNKWGFLWATEVLNPWTNRPPSGVERATIRDDMLHPTSICGYAVDFIRLTTEDDCCE